MLLGHNPRTVSNHAIFLESFIFCVVCTWRPVTHLPNPGRLLICSRVSLRRNASALVRRAWPATPDTKTCLRPA